MAVLKQKAQAQNKPKAPPKKHKPTHLIKGTPEKGKKTAIRTIGKLKIVQNNPQPTPISHDEPEWQEADPLIDKAKIQNQLIQFRKTQEAKINAELDTYYQQEMAHIDNEKKAILNEAHKEGYTQGIEEGYQAIRPQLDALLSKIDEISVQNQQNISQFKGDLLVLSIKIAEKIIKTYLSDHPEKFHNIVDEALTKITDKEKVVIRVNPQQIDAIRHHKDIISKQLPDIKNLEIQSDHLVDFGGCVIETKLGYVDANLPMKLETLSKILDETYKNDPDSQF